MLKTFLVDDEELAIKRMKKLLKPFIDSNRLEIVGSATDAPEALKQINREEIDLLFLDIRMPEMDGFALLERLAPGNRPIVVFTTAYDEYAVKAFQANAVDYLLKPVSKDRLEDAVSRAEKIKTVPENRLLNEEKLARLFDWLDSETTGAPPSPAPSDYLDQVSVPYRDRLIIIPIDQIVSVEVQDGITRFMVIQDQPSGGQKLKGYMVNFTLDELEKKLNPADFMRVHRSSIVNVSRIREMVTWFSGRYKLIMDGKHEVIASRERSKILKKRLSF